MNGHAFNRKIAGFMYCGRCGLIMLGNQATRRAIAQKCAAGD